MCVLSVLDCIQEKLHCAQLQSFSPEWMNLCCLSSLAPLPEKLHCSHMKGFSTGWTCESWVKKLLCRRTHTACRWKVFLQNGLACVSWSYLWVNKRSFTVCNWKAFFLNGWRCDFSGDWLMCRTKLHYLQTKGFSPLSTSMCLFSLKALTLEYPQLFQLWDFFLTWWSKCIFKSFVILKERSRWTQEWGLSSVCISIVLSSQFSLC